MANVLLEVYLEDSSNQISVNVDMNCEHSDQAYELNLPQDAWVTGKELDEIIKLLQKAKRVLRTRTLQEGD